MRLSKKFWIILGIAILAVALGFLFNTYSGQEAEKDELDYRLTEAEEDRLPALIAEKGDLENQLAQARSLLRTSQAKFPQAVESIEYGEDLFRIAYGYDLRAMLAGLDLELTRLSVSTPTNRQTGAVTYSVSSFIVAVSGDVNKILNFIDAIGTQIDYQLPWSFQEPWSVEVKAISLNVAGRTASISLDIYGYKR